MRVTHVLNRLNFLDGGPPRGVVDLCEAIRDRGHDVSFITTDVTDVPSSWSDSISVLKVNPPDRPLGFFSKSNLDSAVGLVSSSDVVHFHGVWERLNHQLASACRRSGTPYVMTLRGMLDDWSMEQGGWYKRLFLKLYGQKYLDRASCIQCTAHGELRQSSKWFPQTKTAVIPNLMDLSLFRDSPSVNEAKVHFGDKLDGISLLFLSRIHEKKGLEYLIEAMPKIQSELGTCNLIIAGDGHPEYIEKLKLLAEQTGVSRHIHWVGHVGGTLKYSLFQASDLFVLPSSQENFGFVLFESMACGTPVLVSELVDTAEDIERSGGGVRIPQCPSAIADMVVNLSFDTARRRVMSQQGREWVLKNLDGKDVAVRIEEMYKEALVYSG